MIFSVNSDKLNGVLKYFKNKETPRIQLIPSSTAEQYVVGNILDYSSTDSHWASSESDGLNSNLVVKFVYDKFLVTHYSIRSHFSTGNYMQAWTLEGSNDNINFETLHTKTKNAELKSSAIGQYAINPNKKGFRYFRIKQTIKTVDGTSNMRISGLDFFGTYPYVIPTTKSAKKISNNFRPRDNCAYARTHVYGIFLFLKIVYTLSKYLNDKST